MNPVSFYARSLGLTWTSTFLSWFVGFSSECVQTLTFKPIFNVSFFWSKCLLRIVLYLQYTFFWTIDVILIRNACQRNIKIFDQPNQLLHAIPFIFLNLPSIPLCVGVHCNFKKDGDLTCFEASIPDTVFESSILFQTDWITRIKRVYRIV